MTTTFAMQNERCSRAQWQRHNRLEGVQKKLICSPKKREWNRIQFWSSEKYFYSTVWHWMLLHWSQNDHLHKIFTNKCSYFKRNRKKNPLSAFSIARYTHISVIPVISVVVANKRFIHCDVACGNHLWRLPSTSHIQL